MLTQKEIDNLSERLEKLSCTNPQAGKGLFGFVLGGEQDPQKLAYERHVAECEYCRTALELYRYKRDTAKVYNKWARASEIIAKAGANDSGILKRNLGNSTAYFQPGEGATRGITVVIDRSGVFLSVEEQGLDEFERLKDK